MDPVRESLEDMQVRHRRELKDLQGRITSKKKNATKKTRRGVNEECAEMERVLRERQAGEVSRLQGGDEDAADDDDDGGADGEAEQEDRGGALGEHTRSVDDATGTNMETDMAKMDLGGRREEQEQRQQQQQQQQQQPAKKRNRQKDRLARRAAERAVAAEEAAAEASTMTDHRGRERTSLKRVFEQHGLVEKEIAPDGHCLFAAVADQLVAHGVVSSFDEGQSTSGKPDPPYKVVRRAAAEYMASNRHRFEGFMEEDLETYVVRMRDTAEWGGQLELMALAGRYGVEIRVVQDGGRLESIKGGEGDGKEESKVLWLAYYRFGFGLGEHYNSLRAGVESLG
ncbi:hypothetical protein E4U21_007105 [Claviceps maximensis]|nr:hypothetical protein E4U21_007105 [Claviceps maximensis]